MLQPEYNKFVNTVVTSIGPCLKNPDEYRIPVPQGSEPEQQPSSENRRWLWIAVTFLFISSLFAAAAIIWLRSEDEPIQAIVGDEGFEVEMTTITRVGQKRIKS